MAIGLIGKKIGMTREFFDSGISVPVTVLSIEKGRILDVITKEKRGYDAIRVGFGKIKNSKLTKQMKGVFAKKSTEPKKILKEFRVTNISDYKEGSEIGLELFKDQKFIDVTSKTIGKGFAGVMKRYNFSGNRASHGVSISHRSHGSTGQNQDPGRVFKGKKMAGHMGDKVRTMQNLEIIKSDLENNLIFVKGSIPGTKNSVVLIQKTSKTINKKTILEKNKKVEAEQLKSATKKVEKKDSPNKTELKKDIQKKRYKGKKMKLQVINIEGKKLENIEISDKIFSAKINKHLIQSIIDWQQNHFKSRTAKTKQRNEIKGSTAKIYAQKGTGGARHSSRKAPLFVGGGVAHGPKGAVYKVKKINKKIKKIGLAQILSQKNKINSLFVVEDFKKEITKTKLFFQFLEKNKLKDSLLISDKNSKSKIIKSARNIPSLKIIEQEGANVYDLIKYKNVIFTTTSIKSLQDRLLKWKNLII